MKKDMTAIMQRWGFSRPIKGMKVTRIGRHHFQVESETRPEITHMVDTEGDFPHCTCEAHTMSKQILCKHMRRVGMLQEAELLPKEKYAHQPKEKK